MEANTVIDDGSGYVRQWLRTEVYNSIAERALHWRDPQCDIAQLVLDKATIGQLFRLYRYSQEKMEYSFISFDPADILAIDSMGMFIAILPDGSAHT